ncbi:ATP-binding protein [Phenylobacterium sp.]|uniref:ATP-binding protein n=1 Tax=Phenylobacterium sp. TaxID=1871053 RepID=UPI0012271AE5|nr:ATP-binding protein [Phenylobacterium sp.]THD64733.1 MAG: response regulator [Phenylobacterium sp.]
MSAADLGEAPPAGALRIDPVRAECIRTLFQQIRNSFAAAGVVTVYMCATQAPFHPWTEIAAWLAVQLSTQAFRVWLVARYRRIPADDDGTRLERAARLNTLYMLIAGCVWGSTAFLFMDTAQPITVALTLCGLYGISGGSVPGNAYNPSGLYAFVGAIFGLVMLRFLLIGQYVYDVLGLASVGYSAILFGFCRVQNRELREGFAIRFENRRLLAALEVEKAEAEAARGRAEKANLAKSQLLAAASHDLRQPLHALSLFSGSLQSLALDDEAKDVAARIQANVAAMEKLFNGLLDISRLEAGVVQSSREPVACQDLFDRLAGYFDPVAEQQGLDLRFRETDLWVDADPALTEQICVNLVTNALRYTRTGGILVAARRRRSSVSIEVADTGIGIGIARADQGRIFDEFVQLGNPERDRGKGLGLGLAIAQRLAAIMGSRIEISSQPGKGSRFAFALPRAQPAALARAAPAPDLMLGMRLLLIDDDAMVREGAGLLLGQWGVKAALAADLAAAEALIAENPRFDICLADYRLPGDIDGLQVIARLQASPKAPGAFCLVTGDMGAEVLAAADAARTPIIHKPLHPARLRALLNHLAAGRAAASATRPFVEAHSSHVNDGPTVEKRRGPAHAAGAIARWRRDSDHT